MIEYGGSWWGCWAAPSPPALSVHHSAWLASVPHVGHSVFTRCFAPSSPYMLHTVQPCCAQHSYRWGAVRSPASPPACLHLYISICKRLHMQLFTKVNHLTPSFTFVYHRHSAAVTVHAVSLRLSSHVVILS